MADARDIVLGEEEGEDVQEQQTMLETIMQPKVRRCAHRRFWAPPMSLFTPHLCVFHSQLRDRRQTWTSCSADPWACIASSII